MDKLYISFTLNQTRSKRVFGWNDFERKERKRKEIGRKIFYFLCLVEGKN